MVAVTDDGPGIASDLVPDIFGRFVRGDGSRSRAAGSTGLGLAIVAAVIEAHSGSVSVQSRPGRTTFTIRLPSPASEPASPPPEDHEAVPVLCSGASSGDTLQDVYAEAPGAHPGTGAHPDRTPVPPARLPATGLPDLSAPEDRPGPFPGHRLRRRPSRRSG